MSSDHETRIVEFICLGWMGSVIDQVLDNVQSSIETGGAQRSRQRRCTVINIGSGANQRFYDIQVAITFLEREHFYIFGRDSMEVEPPFTEWVPQVRYS